MICGTGSKIDTQAQVKASAQQLKSWARRAKSSLHLLMALTLADAVCLCAFYACIAYSFGPFILRQDASFLPFIFYALIPVGLRFLLRAGIARLIAHMSYVIEGGVREELMLQVLRVGPLSSTVQSSLSTLLIDAFDDIMPYFTSFLVALRYAMIIPVVILLAVALVSPWSALILFLMAPLIPFFMIIIGKGAERLNQRQWKQITRLAGRFYEACDKLLVIKLFNLEKREIERIARLTRRWRVETMQVLRIAFLSALVLEFFATCGIALCAITLGFAVYEHGFDYSKALFVLLCAPEFFLPLRQLGLNYHARMRALGAMSGLMQLLHEQSIFKLPNQIKPQFAHQSTDQPRVQQCHTQQSCTEQCHTKQNKVDVYQMEQNNGLHLGDSNLLSQSTYDDIKQTADIDCTDQAWLQPPFTIELSHVFAVYPNGHVGLQDFSGVFQAQQTTALIGPSGAGKSTLLQTIAGFTKVLEGQIIVNSHVCSQDDLLELMKRMAYIPQLPHLFYGTLRDNLKLGAPEATDEDLIQALHQAGAGHLLTRFADGLEHKVGDNNRGVSGGEVRLIALARAFVRQCDLLLLDEPTASLDQTSEQAFLEALAKIRKHKTIIMTAHRPELMDFADKIIEIKPVFANQDAENQEAENVQNLQSIQEPSADTLNSTDKL